MRVVWVGQIVLVLGKCMEYCQTSSSANKFQVNMDWNIPDSNLSNTFRNGRDLTELLNAWGPPNIPCSRAKPWETTLQNLRATEEAAFPLFVRVRFSESLDKSNPLSSIQEWMSFFISLLHEECFESEFMLI